MAIPTQVTLAMTRHFDPWNTLGSVGIVGMAFPAQSPLYRFLCQGRPGIGQMLCSHNMAFRTIQSGVVRHRLLVGDIAMAGGTFLWGMRQQRIVRVMTENAGMARIVQGRYDLRKPRWPSRIIPMTQRAEPPVSRRIRKVFARIFNMFSRRTVTDLAGYTPMIGLVL